MDAGKTVVPAISAVLVSRNQNPVRKRRNTSQWVTPKPSQSSPGAASAWAAGRPAEVRRVRWRPYDRWAASASVAAACPDWSPGAVLRLEGICFVVISDMAIPHPGNPLVDIVRRKVGASVSEGFEQINADSAIATKNGVNVAP
jgi:hypothetical protein